MIPPGEQPGEPGRLGGGKGRVNRLLFGLAKGFGGLKVWCSVKVLEICARVRDKVAKGFAPTSTMRDSHTIGFVPVCRVTASTMQGSERLCNFHSAGRNSGTGGFWRFGGFGAMSKPLCA